MPVVFIDPGELRTELVLESASMVPDGQGGHRLEWSQIALLFARIEPLRAENIAGADQRLRTVTHRITVRFRIGLESGMRLTKLQRIFDIVTVHDPDETGRFLVCLAREEGS